MTSSLHTSQHSQQLDALQQLWSRGRDFLGARTAIMGGAMTWVSERHLVSSLSNAGGFGVLACGSMPPELLEEEICATRALTDQPFGVNLILMHPALSALLDVCVRAKHQYNLQHVVLAGGLPKASVMKPLKDAGIKVMCFAPSLRIGQKLVKMGADALVIEGMEAGGHIGAVSTSVLAQEILPDLHEVPVFVAGGIARGEAIVSYLHMGAAGVQLGTRFVCAHECKAHEAFKQAFIRASARDAQVSSQIDPDFPVIPVRALMNKGTQNFQKFQLDIIAQVRSGAVDKHDAQLKIEHYWAGALRRAVVEGDVENGSLMAGQSVGLVEREQSMQEIIDELCMQSALFLEAHCRRCA